MMVDSSATTGCPVSSASEISGAISRFGLTGSVGITRLQYLVDSSQRQGRAARCRIGQGQVCCRERETQRCLQVPVFEPGVGQTCEKGVASAAGITHDPIFLFEFNCALFVCRAVEDAPAASRNEYAVDTCSMKLCGHFLQLRLRSRLETRECFGFDGTGLQCVDRGKVPFDSGRLGR